VQRLDKFSSNTQSVQWHISSKHTREMSQMSEVVSVVHPHYNYYVYVHIKFHLSYNRKTRTAWMRCQLLCTICTSMCQKLLTRFGEDLPTDEDFYHGILFGRDRLTVCRSRAAQTARRHDDTSIGRLEGLTAVVEDWHARLTLIKVSCLMSYILCRHNLVYSVN